uniref:Uncharacterized protein n=1 Tax=Arundo donax TaxID=35708 RepID=A0A0A9FUB6_ARUDO
MRFKFICHHTIISTCAWIIIFPLGVPWMLL